MIKCQKIGRKIDLFDSSTALKNYEKQFNSFQIIPVMLTLAHIELKKFHIKSIYFLTVVKKKYGCLQSLCRMTALF